MLATGRLSPRGRAALTGAASASPFFLPTLVWGIAFGAAASTAGFDPVFATFMSSIAWSGTAQMAALGNLSQPLYTIFATSLILSLRFVPMSLAFGAMLYERSRVQRALAGALLADGSFGLIARVSTHRVAYLAGTWTMFYFSWIIGTFAGAALGPLVPARYLSLADALIAAIFAVLTVETCTERRLAVVAVGAAALAIIVGLFLPTGLAILIAAMFASALYALMAK